MDSRDRAKKDHADVVSMMNRTRQNRQNGGFFASIGCAVALLMVAGFGTGLYEIIHSII
jgi:hypothetical protein